ncbi:MULTISPECIES: NUDIX hydrolase [Heyndrickxia]|jgi:ADP-ribose pyrophosphatase YjhB (NUDIX family)|uniref:DNA mismatch repair protein MutT n=1 Tax=Heyndrickxia oleronia TaxID=38875 RepID=A0A8E2I4W3_9BACI|nr:NUDIX hydrolase [Heyndrickxia oleronia]NYV68350.1 NUDIX hydrolase [Bacillus sp. Gen3]MBU5210254.1 NUDIX hydrolase [Heyndrickxia oleronia]MCI1592124.1 NUDIX hydrolase [Heyndrickxia oleronia]MCI1615089.1 NUDIX hydrolase [Heyndrickxia oleronia]MCI1763080.1 NUDIX hydrolase [Heyndrickxia oleronia]
MSKNKYHRAFGVYGIYVEEGELLVINKNGGPYTNRFDLPGGSLKEGETLSEAMKREFLEETGLEIEIQENIGVVDFKLPWLWKEFTDVHHIAVYYSVRTIGGNIQTPEQFEGQDSLGAVWVTEKDVSLDNASPLVLKAFEWLRTKDLGIDAEIYQDWKVVK